ncbi:hypothetical protein KC887_02865 [Candidatus Kaiserbacteria bacterium]|nr:hypothetical protein [Candidatus Kaiserbacteria bacterium]
MNTNEVSMNSNDIMNAIEQAMIECEELNRLQPLEAALNSMGVEADVRNPRTTDECMIIPGFGIVMLDSKHGGWWTRDKPSWDLTGDDVAHEREGLLIELFKVTRFVQPVQ